MLRQKKHRAGKRRKAKKDRTRSYLANLLRIEAAEAEARQAAQPESVISDTPLFEQQSEVLADLALVQQAKRERWGTPKPLSERVIVKALKLAAGEEWVSADGSVRKEEWSPPQLIGAAKLALDVERQKQGDEHHGDRMVYHNRALDMRAETAGIGSLTINNNGPSGVAIFIPENFRDTPNAFAEDEDDPADVIDAL